MNRTSVKFFELRSVRHRKTPNGSSRTAAATDRSSTAAVRQTHGQQEQQARKHRHRESRTQSFFHDKNNHSFEMWQVEYNHVIVRYYVHGDCAGSTSSTTLGTGTPRPLLRLGQGRPLSTSERTLSGKTALIALIVPALACCAPNTSFMPFTCAASPRTKLVHPTATRPASPAAGAAFRSLRLPEERTSLKRKL